VRDITTRGADLSRLCEVTAGADIPALVLAQRLYGDAAREDDVLERNPAIRHPGFVPGGLILKVPTDA
jgi:prophage DNA circulation protein